MSKPMDVDEVIPFCVEEGWEDAFYIPNVGGPAYRLLFYSDTKIGFEHKCDRGKRGVIVCAPLLTNVNQRGGHHVTGVSGHATLRHGKPTVRPSILCDDCGTHGFITEGRWGEAYRPLKHEQ
jgi:hypothetical protein